MLLEIQKNYSSNNLLGIIEPPTFWLDQFVINRKLKRMNCNLLQMTLDSNQKSRHNEVYKVIYLNEFDQKFESLVSVHFIFKVFFRNIKMI
jgi:hypothetical protein